MDKTLLDGIGRGLRRAALAGCLGVGAALAAPVVGIQPPLSSVTVGQAFEVTVAVAGVADLFAFQFDLTFDPALLAAVSIAEGAFLPGGGPTFFVPGVIDNALGTINFTADTLFGAVPGVSGDGALAVVRFQAIGLGAGAIDLAGVTLLDSALAAMAFDTAAGRVVVNAAAAPLPGSLALAIAGLAALWARRRPAAAQAAARR